MKLLLSITNGEFKSIQSEMKIAVMNSNLFSNVDPSIEGMTSSTGDIEIDSHFTVLLDYLIKHPIH